MKTFRIIPIFFLSLFFNCSGQNKHNENVKETKPEGNIHVNKEYDEHGNLIKYDSIYTYSYLSNGELNDSIKMQFQRHFNNHSFFNDDFFNDFFKRDSISGQPNYENFFFDGFMNQDEEIKQMMKRMDSIQQLFFNEKQRPRIPAEPKKTSHRVI